MHPTIGYHLAQAQIAETRIKAQRDGLARAARRARPAPRHQRTQPTPRLSAVTRRVLTVLGARATP